jgi:phosphatidylglycerol:prolipoprotein diacylglycerol transferase
MAAVIYGLSRFTIEFFREPDQQLQWLVDASGLSMGQWLTIPMILIGLFLLFTAGARRQRNSAA